jgi:hypothetical protein
MPSNPTLATLADDLASGRTSARKLVDSCLAKIADSSGEGARAFIHVDAEAAIEAAEAMDRLREVNAAPSPLCRHSDLDQGPVRHQGAGDPRRLAGARRFPAGGGRCACRGAAEVAPASS